MNRSKLTYGVLFALLLNQAAPLQANWFTNWFASRGSKVAVAMSAVALAATGIGYFLWQRNKIKQPKEIKVVRFADEPQQVLKPQPPTGPAPSKKEKTKAAASAAPAVVPGVMPAVQQSTLDRLKKKGIAQHTFLADVSKPKNHQPVAAPQPVVQNTEQPQAPALGYTDEDMAQMEANARKIQGMLGQAIVRQKLLANKFV